MTDVQEQSLKRAERASGWVKRATDPADKRRAVRDVIDNLLVVTTGQVSDRTHPLELSGRPRA